MTLDHRGHQLAQPCRGMAGRLVGVLGEVVDDQRPPSKAREDVAVDIATALRAIDIADAHQDPIEVVALGPEGSADLGRDVLLERGRNLYVRRSYLDVHFSSVGPFPATVRSH